MFLVRLACALAIFYVMVVKNLSQTHPKLFTAFMVLILIYVVVSSIPNLLALNKKQINCLKIKKSLINLLFLKEKQ